MAAEIRIVEEADKQIGMNPKKFALWLFMATVVMLFAAWTSAFLVKRGDVGWAEIIVPNQFTINSVIIALSSISMIWAIRSARKDKLETVKLALSVTSVLGIAFLIGQILAYKEMIALKEHFTGGNVSHSFVYVLSGVHGVHLISGVIFLFIVLRATFKYKVHSKNMDLIEMCAMYWHFLGVLWLYLFVFLLVNR